MATTTNKGIEKPTYQQYADDPTGWTDPINANWDLIDSAFGGTYSVPSLTSLSSDVTLTATQCQNARIKLTGTATTAKTINVFFPANIAGMFVVDNATSGPFTINLKSAAVGAIEFVEAAQNANTFIWLSSDAGSEGVYLADNSPLTQGNGITVTGTTVALSTPVSVANGGTGATTYTPGQLLIGNNAGGLTPATLTQGSNITITNGNGSITISASGSAGGVTTFSAGTTGFSPSVATAGAVSLSGTLNIANGGTGATSASNARSNLGLGSMATQSSSSVSISGGSISNATISGTSSINSSGTITTTALGTFSGVRIGSSTFTLVGFDGTVGNFNVSSNTSFYGTNSQMNCAVNSQLIWYAQAGAPGNFTLENNVTPRAYGTTTWTNISDERIKKNISNYTLGLSALNQLQTVTYQFNGLYGSKDDGRVNVGLIAQSVQNTPFSSMVEGWQYKDAKTGVTSDLLSLNTNQLVFALINAVKELDNRVKALEAKLP